MLRIKLSTRCFDAALVMVLAGLAMGQGWAADAEIAAASRRTAAKDMRLVGSNDLQARTAYQPVINQQGGRWIAYIGHHGGSMPNPLTGAVEANGTSIVDITDPKQPKYLHHIPGEPGEGEQGGAQMVRVCNGRDLPKADAKKTYMLRSYGNSAQEMWDVSAPEAPVRITVIADKLKGTHKSWWECDTGIAYLVNGAPDWRTRRMTQIYDLSDPAKPVFIRNFALPGQQPGATGDTPADLHGPISTGPKGNRVYFGYGTNKGGVLQIVDRNKLLTGPKEPTNENLLFPQIARMDLPGFNGAHTTLPLGRMDIAEFAKDVDGKSRDFIAIVNEQILNECLEPRQMVFFADTTTETRPMTVSNFNVPEASGGFCSRGGRFGAHSSNENQPPMYAKRVLFVSWFNAGVRAIDIRDPYSPKEIGHYIPAITDKTDRRCVKVGAAQACKIAIQTNNVEVDDRGYVVIVDRANTGMHILELTGEARKVANFR